MTAPKPMDPERLAKLRQYLEGDRPDDGIPSVRYYMELLADRDHHAAEVESRGALLAEWQLACGRHQRAAFDAQAEVERLHLQLNRANTGMCAGSPNCANGRTFCEYHAAKFEASSKAEAERLNAEVERLRDAVRWGLGRVCETSLPWTVTRNEGRWSLVIEDPPTNPRKLHALMADGWAGCPYSMTLSRPCPECRVASKRCEACQGQGGSEECGDCEVCRGRGWLAAATPTPAEHVLERWGPLLAMLGEGPGGEP